jgi:hypothetical protein
MNNPNTTIDELKKKHEKLITFCWGVLAGAGAAGLLIVLTILGMSAPSDKEVAQRATQQEQKDEKLVTQTAGLHRQFTPPEKQQTNELWVLLETRDVWRDYDDAEVLYVAVIAPDGFMYFVPEKHRETLAKIAAGEPVEFPKDTASWRRHDTALDESELQLFREGGESDTKQPNGMTRYIKGVPFYVRSN